MWNRPQLMMDVADLLLTAGAAALLVAMAIGAARLPLFPVHGVMVVNSLHEVRRVEIERSLHGSLRGNFFSVDLEALRKSLERLPWVRRAEARRVWPASIELNLEEHIPVASWGRADGRLVNSHGEIFVAAMNAPARDALPVFSGPANFVPEMLDIYRSARNFTRKIGRAPRELAVSRRLALQLTLDDGMIVELGRQQAGASIRERLERLVEFYPSVLTAGGKRPEAVDMRYPNGFALRTGALAASPGSESEGRP
jgi:cell division protein FtsQ